MLNKKVRRKMIEQITPITGDGKAQIYLRAEPTEEGRTVIMRHRVHLTKLFEKMGIKAKLASRGDFHKTEIFLDSAYNWNVALKEIGVNAKINYFDVLSLLNVLDGEREITSDRPLGYDIFLSQDGYYVAVLRLEPTGFQEKLLAAVKNAVLGLEEKGLLPRASAEKLIASKNFPLARDLFHHKPHITLIRGKIKNVNIRKVAEKVIKEAPLITADPIVFDRLDIRSVRSQKVISQFA